MKAISCRQAKAQGCRGIVRICCFFGVSGAWPPVASQMTIDLQAPFSAGCSVALGEFPDSITGRFMERCPFIGHVYFGVWPCRNQSQGYHSHGDFRNHIHILDSARSLIERGIYPNGGAQLMRYREDHAFPVSRFPRPNKARVPSRRPGSFAFGAKQRPCGLGGRIHHKTELLARMPGARCQADFSLS